MPVYDFPSGVLLPAGAIAVRSEIAATGANQHSEFFKRLCWLIQAPRPESDRIDAARRAIAAYAAGLEQVSELALSRASRLERHERYFAARHLVFLSQRLSALRPRLADDAARRLCELAAIAADSERQRLLELPRQAAS
jgi:hypothetical protein